MPTPGDHKVKLWMRNRAAVTVVLTGVLTTVLAILTGPRVITLPEMFTGLSLPIPLALFAPLIPAVLLGWSLGRRPARAEDESPRATQLAIADLTLCLIVGFSFVGAAISDPDIGAAGLRNAVVAGMVTWLTSRWAPTWMASAPWLIWMAASTFAGGGYGRDAWWALPRTPARAPQSIAGTVVIVLAVAVTLVLWSRGFRPTRLRWRAGRPSG